MVKCLPRNRPTRQIYNRKMGRPMQAIPIEISLPSPVLGPWYGYPEMESSDHCMTACHHISLINCTTSTDRKYLHWPLRVNKYKDQQIIFEIKCSRMLSILAEIESNIFSWKCVVSPLSDPLLYIQANKKKSVSEASVDIWMAFSICKLKICWEKFSWVLKINIWY